MTADFCSGVMSLKTSRSHKFWSNQKLYHAKNDSFVKTGITAGRRFFTFEDPSPPHVRERTISFKNLTPPPQ